MLYIWGINSLSRGMGTVQGGKPPHKRPSENTVISICTRGHSKSFCSCLDSLSKFQSTIISLYVVFTTIERQVDDVVQSLSGSKGSTYLHQQCHLPSTSDTQSLRELVSLHLIHEAAVSGLVSSLCCTTGSSSLLVGTDYGVVCFR